MSDQSSPATGSDLANQPITADTVGLLEGLCSTRAIRRYRPDPVPDDLLRDVLFAATRAPSGSNRQNFRFVVLRDGETACEAKRLIAEAAQAIWGDKRKHDGYDSGSGAVANSPKARMAVTMQRYVQEFASVPVLLLPCFTRHRAANVMEGASVYPACQNVLLAARAVGLGGVLTGFHAPVEPQIRTLLQIPDEVVIAATITLGFPEGRHGPVRRRPMQELIYDGSWGATASWIADPPGVANTQAGPPKGF